MRSHRLLPLLVAGLVLASACGDDNRSITGPTPPTAPSLSLTPSQAATDARMLIGQLFPVGPLQVSAQTQLAALVADVTAVPPRLDRAKVRAWGLIIYTGAFFQQGKLLDPNGSAAPTTQEAFLSLVCDISIIGQLKLEDSVCKLNPSSLSGDGKVALVHSSADAIPDVVVTDSKSAALRIPAGLGDVLVVLSRYRDDEILQNVYPEIGPKWRMALSPTPPRLPDNTPDAQLFEASSCVGNDGVLRPSPKMEPYIRVIHVSTATKKVDVPKKAPPLAENSGCKLAEHLADATRSGVPHFASRGLTALSRLTSYVTSFVRPQPLYATSRTYRFDVGGVGGLLADMGSDFPLGFVLPDLRIQTAPSLGAESVVQGGTVQISSWTLRNIQQSELNANQPARPALSVVPAGDGAGDVAVVTAVRDPVTGVAGPSVPLPPVRHGYYLSADQIFDATDIPLTSGESSPSTPRADLIDGGSSVVDGDGRSLTIPVNAPTGARYILVVVDDDHTGDEGALGMVPEVRPLAGNGNLDGEANNVVALPITITPRLFGLSVTGAGAGSGSVTSIPEGVSCRVAAGVATGSCQSDFVVGTAVTLSASAAGDSRFVGWSGACTGETCSVTMSEARSVTATFTLPPRVLIYGPSLMDPPVTGKPQNERTIAVLAGLNVTVWDATTWGTKTTADFAQFNAIIIGDPNCSGGVATPRSLLDAAEANKAVWSPVVTGPMVVIGADPIFHQSQVVSGTTTPIDAVKLISNGIKFAASNPGRTGLYVSLACYYTTVGTTPTPVTFLDQIGIFQVIGFADLSESVEIVDATHPLMQGLSSTGLSNWNASGHEAFPSLASVSSYPAGFGSVATIARSSRPLEKIPYIIARNAAP